MSSFGLAGIGDFILFVLFACVTNAVPFSAVQNNTLTINGTSNFNFTSYEQDATTSISPSSSSTASSTESSPTYSPMSQPALLPDVHWDQPVGDIQNIAPTENLGLYYSSNGASNPSEQHTFAQVNYNASHPTVVLAHSQFIQGVTCSGNEIHIQYTDQESLNYAQTSWSASFPLIIVTYTEGCGEPSNQRAFWLVNEISISSGSSQPSSDDSESSGGSGSSSSQIPSGEVIRAVVQQQLSIEEAMPEVEVVWGTYRPDDSTGAASKSHSTSPPVGSGKPGKGGGSGYGNSTTSTGTNSTTNSNSSSPSNGTCGAPPSRMIDGFFTATCGSPTFDQDIDNEIGFLDFDSSDYSASLKDFAPGLDDDDNPSDNEDFGPVESKRLTLKRRSFLSGLKSVLSKGASIVAKVGQGAVALGKKVGNAVSDALAVTPEASLDIPINVGPTGLVDSPFGQAKEIYSKSKESQNGKASGNISVYCVGCGVHGTVHLHGQARFTIADGLTQANAGFNGNIEAGLEIGIDANAEYSDTLTYPIISTAVPPGFSLPGVFAIGPVITLDAELELGVTLAGQVLAGITMTIPNFSANLDLVDKTKSVATGFTPQFKKIFEAKTAITATAALGLPLGLGLGIDIPPLKFKKTAALYEKPSIGATITYSGSTTNEGIGGDKSCLNGIEYSLQFGNDIYVDFFGEKKININSLKVPIAGACIPLGAGNNTTGNTGSGGTDSGSTNGNGDVDTNAGSGTTDAESPERRAILLDFPPIGDVLLKRQNNANEPNTTNSTTDPYAFVDSDDPGEAANDSEFDTLSNEALAAADSDISAPTANDTGVIDDPGASFVNINDVGGTYTLEADPITGNIYVGNPGEGSLFASSEGYVVGDDSGRYLHYYPDLMTAYNVSRFRLSDETSIPKDADFIVLAPVAYDTSSQTPDFYAALDTSGNVFLTITCDIDGELSKVFLAQDAEEGIKALMNPHLRYTVTGGIVTNCYYLPFVAPSNSSTTS